MYDGQELVYWRIWVSASETHCALATLLLGECAWQACWVARAAATGTDMSLADDISSQALLVPFHQNRTRSFPICLAGRLSRNVGAIC